MEQLQVERSAMADIEIMELLEAEEQAAVEESQNVALEDSLAKVKKVADVCTALGLKVDINGSWVIITDGDDVTTWDVKDILGKNGLGLQFRPNRKKKKPYWLYASRLPEGFYWDKKDKKIKKRGEE